MVRHAAPAGADLLKEVERLAGEGYGKGEIAERLGFRSPSTFSGRLVRASQQTGTPIPAFRSRSNSAPKKPVESVQVKPRGRGGSFGVNVPQEPLERLGAKPGDTLAMTVGRRRLVLAIQHDDKAAQAPTGPRLVKNRRRR